MSTGWWPRSSRASPPPACTSADRLRRVLAVRQLPVRPGEVAGVPARIALEVVRVLGLGLPEPDGLTDLGHDLAGPQARGVDVGDRVLGHLALLVARWRRSRTDSRSRCPRPGGPWSSGRGFGRRSPRNSRRQGSRSRCCASWCSLSRCCGYPKVKTYARTPGPANVISNVRSAAPAA